MSSPDHSTSNIKDVFSSNFPDYTTASPGNISPDPPANLSKYLFASLAISHFHNVQAYNVIANKPPIPPQDPITPPTILTPSTVLPPSPLFDPQRPGCRFVVGVSGGGSCVHTEDVAKPTPPSPTPTTSPPPPQELPFTSHVTPSSPPSPIAPPSSPPKQQQPSQPTTISMDLLHTLLETCTTLTMRVKNLEQDKIAQALKITKLKQRVRKLEKKRKS
nr:hypothetical protein [Tanacetum cinerariifolium]